MLEPDMLSLQSTKSNPPSGLIDFLNINPMSRRKNVLAIGRYRDSARGRVILMISGIYLSYLDRLIRTSHIVREGERKLDRAWLAQERSTIWSPYPNQTTIISIPADRETYDDPRRSSMPAACQNSNYVIEYP